MQPQYLKSTYRLLDKILEDFANLPESPFRSTASFALKYKAELSQTTVTGILEKLTNDGYLHFAPDENKFEQGFYRLTFAGRLFYAEGGYLNQYKRDNRTRFNNTILNIAVGLGGAAAALYYIFEFYTHIILGKPAF